MPLAIIAALLILITTVAQVRANDDRAGLDYKLYGHKASVATLNALGAGEPQEVIGVFDDQPIQSEAATMCTENPDPSSRQAIQEFKRQALGRLKQEVLSAVSSAVTSPV